MDAALACMKYILFTFNFLLWCFGAALMGLGIWIRADNNFWEYSDKLPLDQYYSACYIVITVGAFITIIGFLGCCGAATESPCMLIFYFAFTVLMVILEFTAAGLVWKIANSEQLEEHLHDHIIEHVQKFREEYKSRRFLDIIQLHLHCCGARDKDDYNNIGITIPQSCHDTRTNNLFYHGCSEMLRTWLEKRAAIIGGIPLGLALMQVAALIFSMCLFCALRQETKEYM